jgi:large subunit ribosomal protein L9
MKVILQEDVKSLGKVGDVVRVKNGYARNFLLPRRLAVEATERRVKEFEHLQKVAESKKKKAVVKRKEVVQKLSSVTVTFHAEAGDKTDKLFGAITTSDISNELEKLGYIVDKKEIHVDGPIKLLGQHKATIKLGEGIEAVVAISVERK